MKSMALTAAIVLITTTANAQWLHQPTTGLSRLANGAPDLAAPVPRTPDGRPDLSGIWQWRVFYYNVAEDLKRDEIQPWARELVARRMEKLATDDPASFQCLPLGPRLNLYPPLLAKIVQTPALIVLLSEGLTYRQVFLDGRELPNNPNPSFMGYSIGHWDGDTLVIETVGFKDVTWLDQSGNPHSEALRVTERLRRPDVGHLEVDERLEDPAIYAKPLTVRITADLVPDTELLEYVCAENEKDVPHLIGRASDDTKTAVPVPASVLEKYVGSYDLPWRATASTPNVIKITLTDGTLLFGGRPLIPLSTTRFTGAVQLEFLTNGDGEVTHVIIHTAGGDVKGTRIPAPR
jgi:hypothetical protein